MEIRRASTVAGVPTVGKVDSGATPVMAVSLTAARSRVPEKVEPGSTPVIAGAVPAARSRRRRDNRPVVRAVTLTREQEYGFIRTDLRRLVLLSAVLVVTMIVVLFVVESLV
jgi:hypothetical protein